MKIIAIDPGLRGSGVAVWSDGEFNALQKMDLWDLYDLIENEGDYFYLVEDSNLGGGNWHGATSRANVGKNQAVSTLIVEYLKRTGRRYKALAPAGYSARYTDSKGRFSKTYKKIFEAETGWGGPSNKDSRAAAAMVVSNLHIVKPIISDELK